MPAMAPSQDEDRTTSDSVQSSTQTSTPNYLCKMPVSSDFRVVALTRSYLLPRPHAVEQISDLRLIQFFPAADLFQSAQAGLNLGRGVARTIGVAIGLKTLDTLDDF